MLTVMDVRNKPPQQVVEEEGTAKETLTLPLFRDPLGGVGFHDHAVRRGFVRGGVPGLDLGGSIQREAVDDILPQVLLYVSTR